MKDLKTSRKTGKKFAREGAALITVIVIMLAGTALLGAAFYLHGGFMGRATVSINRTEELNNLDSAVQKGKLLLETTIKEDGEFPMASFKEHDPAPRSIDLVDDLLAYNKDDKELQQSYNNDNIVVSIYDLDYGSEHINLSMSSEDRAMLPPAITDDDDSNDHHSYLIRAIRKRSDNTGMQDVVEVAIMAYKSPDVTP